MARRLSLIRQVGAFAGVALLVSLLALVALPGYRSDRVRALHGTIPVEASHQGTSLGTAELDLPGQFALAGLPPDARIRARWEVHLPPDQVDPWAVWVERPQYAARLTWDGQLIGRAGDLDGPRRSERGILAPVPVGDQGIHVLELVVQGDYGKGAVLGRVLHGPLDELLRLSRWAEAEKVGLVLLLSALGLLHLVLAARRPSRPTNLFLGLLCLDLAVYLFFRTDLSTSYVPEALPGLRIRRFTTAWIVPLALGVAATFDRKRAPRWVEWVAAAMAMFSLGAFILPPDGLTILEVALDAALFIGALVFVVVITPVAWRGRAGAMVLVLATVFPVAFGALSEILVTNGLAAGSSHLLVTVGTFAIGATIALGVRDATQSERHDRFLASSADAMLAVGPDLAIESVNPAARRLFGSDVIGAPLPELVEAEDRPLLEAHVRPDAHRPDHAEFRLSDSDLILESVSTPLDNRTQLLVVRDVTRRRRLDQGMLQAARMETLAVLVGGVAHDFNNLLGTLLAHVGFLQVSLSSSSKLQQRLGRMETTIERASVLTRRLLALSGGSGGTLVPVDLARIAEASASLVRTTLPEGQHLELDVPASLPEVAASATDLEHVLVNLMVNARDAMGQAGTQRVVARPFATDEGARGVLIAVEDEGPGVPLELREKIFTPFFTTKDPRRGTGLGLAVATQIVREHHGRLWVEDRPGGGARFCIALHEARLLDVAEAPAPTGLRVLLVEDEAVLRDTFAHALSKAGHRVIALPDGSAALGHVEQEAPDILVTDVLMPGLNGVDLARLVRGRHPHVPVLLVSGYIPDDRILDDDPMVHRLDKPVRASRLVATVGRLARQAKRRADGQDTRDETAFPPLEDITWESVRWGSPAPPPTSGWSPGRSAGTPSGAPAREAGGDEAGDQAEEPTGA
jgi:signal transduction histidine kinase/CheY-like chemotaxis protein